MAHFRHHFSPPHMGVFCSGIRPVLIREYQPKRVILGDRWNTDDLPKIFENRGQSTTVCRGPILNSNRGSKCPIFGNISGPPPPRTCFVPEFGMWLFEIGYRGGPVSGSEGLHMILLKFRGIAGNLPLLGEALFRTLISARNAPFSAPF